jgi:trehalose/maltose transport system substrate-binding protein
MASRSSTRSRGRPRGRRVAGSVATLALASSLLTACGGDGGKPELVWYINPDSGGQAAIAEDCSTDDYTITTQVLPQASDQQRIQLARRLAAKDPAIDLMSLDPPFTAEFADAGFLAKVPQDAKSQLEEQGTFQGAMDAATWEDELVVFPFWSNTQVLWYRKSFVEKAGIDMSKPVTWDQIIDAASENDGKIGVQANKYEGYVVWINALIESAGGHILEDADKGVDATLTIQDEPGKIAAGIIEKLASSPASPSDLSVSNEGTAGSTFGSDQGSFLVNWTYIFHNYDETAPDVAKDIGYTRYPQAVEGEDSRPPYGGIGIGVSEFSDEKEYALEAAACLVEPDQQGKNAEMTGNMPASTAGYEYPALKEIYPQDLLQLFQDSVNAAAPRTVTPYWSDVSSSIQGTWHPPASVDDNTPESSKEFIEEILKGGKLL